MKQFEKMKKNVKDIVVMFCNSVINEVELIRKEN